MKISVALCTWNGEKYLAEQLGSIFAQTYAVNEIIICDDQSTDKTVSIILHFEKQFPGIIHLVQNKKALQARKNFEQAITRCTGDLIFLCDQDDRWLENKVADTVDFFTKQPNAVGVFTNGFFLGDEVVMEYKTLWGALSFSAQLQQMANEYNLLEMLLKLNNFVTGAALCFKKEAKAYILPLYCPKPHWHDYWIALQIAVRNQLYFLDKKLIHYRVHASQQTGFSVARLDDDEAAFKEAVWQDNYNGLRTAVVLPFVGRAITRCKLYQKHMEALGQDAGRLNKLAMLLKKHLNAVKQQHYAQLGFIGKKKLFIKSCLRPLKYSYISFKDRIILFFR